jgi:hypothetical protein
MDAQQSDKVEKWAEIIRSLLAHETEVINQRITWLVTIQGLLYTGLGFAWDKADARQLVTIFSILGTLVALSAHTALGFAFIAAQDLVQWWEDHKDGYTGPDVAGGRPTPKSDRDIRWLGIRRLDTRWLDIRWLLSPWRSLPWIFVFGWVMVAITNFAR